MTDFIDVDVTAARAAQALAILEALEALPKGRGIHLYHHVHEGWSVAMSAQVHGGETATDALGQLSQTLVIESEAP